MPDPHSETVEWVRSFPLASARACKSLSDLASGLILLDILQNIFPESSEASPDSHDHVLDLVRATQTCFLLYLKREIVQYPLSYKGIVSGDPQSINAYVELLFLAQVECSRSEELLPQILCLSEPTKAYIAQVVDSLRDDPRLQYVDDLFGNEASELRQHLINQREVNQKLENELLGLHKNDDGRFETLEQEKLDLEIKLAQVTGELEASLHAKDNLISNIENLTREALAREEVARSIKVYKQTIEMLENKISALQDTGQGNIYTLQEKLEELTKEKEDLRMQLIQENSLKARLQEDATNREKELGQFVMTGGALGGELRDKVIKTLQEQLTLREEELEFFKTRDFESQEEQRKGERLLVSAIHAIALKYHEEMVSSFEQAPAPDEDSSTIQEEGDPPDPKSSDHI